MMRIEDVVVKTIIAGELHIASACKMFMPYAGNCFGKKPLRKVFWPLIKEFCCRLSIISPSLSCALPPLLCLVPIPPFTVPPFPPLPFLPFIFKWPMHLPHTLGVLWPQHPPANQFWWPLQWVPHFFTFIQFFVFSFCPFPCYFVSVSSSLLSMLFYIPI